MIKLIKLFGLLSLGLFFPNQVFLSSNDQSAEVIDLQEDVKSYEKEILPQMKTIPVGQDDEPSLIGEAAASQVPFEDFKNAVAVAQKTAYSGVLGARPCLFGIGNGGVAIVNKLVERAKSNRFLYSLLTLVTDLEACRLNFGYKKSINGLSLTQKSRALMLKLGDRRSTNGAGGNPEVARTKTHAAEKYFAEVLDPDMVRMKPNLCIIVAAVGGGTGTGGVKALIDMARDHGVPSIVFMVLPFNKGPRECKKAMESFEYAIKYADTVIPVSMDTFVKSNPSVMGSGDVRRTELFDEEVADRIISLVEMIADNVAGYSELNSSDLADLRSRMGLSANSLYRIYDGKISVIASATVKGKGGIKEALEIIYRKLCTEYKDFKNVIRNGEEMLISVQHDGTHNDQGIESEIMRMLPKIGFLKQPGVKIGQRVKIISENDSVGCVEKVPSVKVTLFIGSLDFGEKPAASSFGLADKNIFQRVLGY